MQFNLFQTFVFLVYVLGATPIHIPHWKNRCPILRSKWNMHVYLKVYIVNHTPLAHFHTKKFWVNGWSVVIPMTYWGEVQPRGMDGENTSYYRRARGVLCRAIWTPNRGQSPQINLHCLWYIVSRILLVNNLNYYCNRHRGLVVSHPLIINLTLFVNTSNYSKFITIYGMIIRIANWITWDDNFSFSMQEDVISILISNVTCVYILVCKRKIISRILNDKCHVFTLMVKL